MISELFLKVIQGEEKADRIKAFLVFPVATLHLAIMSGRVRTDQLMLDAQPSGGFLKKGGDIPFTVGKTVCKFKTVVSLGTFHTDTSAGIPLHQFLQEVRGGVSRLRLIGRQEAELGDLANGGMLKQAKRRVCHTLSGDHLHIHLSLFSRTSHLLVRLCV